MFDTFITATTIELIILIIFRVESISNDLAYSFNGEGYAVRSRVNSGPYNKYTFGVSINFKTYDENALLFLAIDPKNVKQKTKNLKIVV